MLTNRRLIVCIVFVFIVFAPMTAMNANRPKGGRHQNAKLKSQKFDNKIMEKNRTKTIERVKLNDVNDMRLKQLVQPPKPTLFDYSNPQNLLSARSPQVTHVKTLQHYLPMHDLNNSEFNLDFCHGQLVKKEAKFKWGCKPRETVVHLEHELGYILSPNAVTVKRCDGMCDLHSKCTPKETHQVEFPIREIQNGQPTCGNISITEHLSCRCVCAERRANCSPSQIYDQEECKCKCPPNDNQICPNRKMEFDSKECKCKCKRTRKCTTGTDWDARKCRCIKR